MKYDKKPNSKNRDKRSNNKKQTKIASTHISTYQFIQQGAPECPLIKKGVRNEDQEARAKGDQGRPAVIRISKSQV